MTRPPVQVMDDLAVSLDKMAVCMQQIAISFNSHPIYAGDDEIAAQLDKMQMTIHDFRELEHEIARGFESEIKGIQRTAIQLAYERLISELERGSLWRPEEIYDRMLKLRQELEQR